MNNMPEFGRHFHMLGDLSSMRIDGKEGNMCLRVYLRLNNAWVNNLNQKSENLTWKRIEQGKWTYLFEFSSENILSNSFEEATEKFICEALGVQYMQYLEENKFPLENREEAETFVEETSCRYQKIVKHLQNDSYVSFEVWNVSNGVYRGYACEVERDKYSGVDPLITNINAVKKNIARLRNYLKTEKRLTRKEKDEAKEQISYWEDQLENHLIKRRW